MCGHTPTAGRQPHCSRRTGGLSGQHQDGTRDNLLISRDGVGSLSTEGRSFGKLLIKVGERVTAIMAVTGKSVRKTDLR